MTQRLGVNVDHVATLRQARRVAYPDPVMAAAIAEMAGADQITVHLREDRRHIQDRDVRIIRQTCQTALNLEMAATEGMVKVACEIKPEMVTLVPERREELTTEGGLDVRSQLETIRVFTHTLKKNGIIVSLFVDPEFRQIEACQQVEADQVELHTGRYCDAGGQKEIIYELERIGLAARQAREMNMRVAAGHGLNYDNVKPISQISEIEELNIGHALISRAVLVGLDRAVRDMISAMSGKG